MAKIATADVLGRGSYNGGSNSKNIVMADILSPNTRVEAPFIRVKIGSYSFGVYESSTNAIGANGMSSVINAKYPNFVRSLTIQKINGTVNMYTLVIDYPITQDDDPNFFEKLFSSVSTSRKIEITYGDSLLPNYVYRDEEAIITDLQSDIQVSLAVITYTVSATSSANLTLSASYNFPTRTAKMSDIQQEMLYNENSTYHLLDVFTGMKDREQVLRNGWLDTSDAEVTIPTKVGMSSIDYLYYTTKCQTATGQDVNAVKKNSVYSLTTYEDTTGEYGGPYFKIQKVETSPYTLNTITTYLIDIGHPTSTIVSDFSLTDNGGWSIYYDYASSILPNDTVKRINDKGELVDQYSPLLAGTKYNLYESDKTWWTKVTKFTSLASIRIKGVLKPAILMTYLKVNVWFYGRKHIASGYYIITSQTDTIDKNGAWTTLTLTKVASDEEE